MAELPPSSFVVFCTAYERVVAFYRDALELPLVAVEPSHTILDCGGAWLIVHPALEHVVADIAADTPPVRREAGAIKPMLRVADIADARTKAARLGGRIDPPETEWPWRGMMCCKGHDPEGNIFEVMQPEA